MPGYLPFSHSHRMVPHIFVIMPSPFVSLCIVHGFEKASYNVIEDTNLRTTFSLNVKGTTTLLGAVTGEITSVAGGTSRKFLLL